MKDVTVNDIYRAYQINRDIETAQHIAWLLHAEDVILTERYRLEGVEVKRT